MNGNLRDALCEVKTLIAVGSYAVAIGALLELSKANDLPAQWFNGLSFVIKQAAD